MWLFAAFGEEFLFRGYYMKGVAELLGNTNKGWLISAILISIYFGIAHSYQGPAGMIAVGIAGFCFSLIFYKNRDNLALAVFVHGFYDMIGLTLLYYSKERVIVEWVERML
jgi:membrane protease YdiL (CAAX protease family)